MNTPPPVDPKRNPPEGPGHINAVDLRNLQPPMWAGSHRLRMFRPSVKWGTSPWEKKMRTIFLALAISATIFATGGTPVVARDRITPVATSEDRYCLQGDEFAGAGDCEFASYPQCQVAASGRMATCAANPNSRGQSLSRERRRPNNSCQATSSMTPSASRANQMAWSAVYCKARNRSGVHSGQVRYAHETDSRAVVDRCPLTNADRKWLAGVKPALETLAV